MRVVFSIGGSVLAPNYIDAEYVKKAGVFLGGLLGEYEVAAVVGGGKPAREKISRARDKGASWAECDYIGILCTRDNARALMDSLGEKAVDCLPESLKEAVEAFDIERVLVMGGTEPGHSTDAVAALLADWLKADLFVNASNVDAVYDKNPSQHDDATALDEITVDDLMSLLSGEGFNAGEYPLLDPLSLQAIKRSSIETLVLNGRDFENMEKAISEKRFRGTRVLPGK